MKFSEVSLVPESIAASAGFVNRFRFPGTPPTLPNPNPDPVPTALTKGSLTWLSLAVFGKDVWVRETGWGMQLHLLS